MLYILVVIVPFLGIISYLLFRAFKIKCLFKEIKNDLDAIFLAYEGKNLSLNQDIKMIYNLRHESIKELEYQIKDFERTIINSIENHYIGNTYISPYKKLCILKERVKKLHSYIQNKL